MKKMFILAIVGLFITAPAHAQLSTINSFYPAPSARYRQIRLIPQAAKPDPCPPGTIYALAPTGEIRHCYDMDNDGNGEWVPLISAWKQDGDKVFLNDTSDTVNVGIGTDTPELKLTLDKGDAVPDGGILSFGTFGDGETLNVSPDGPIFLWYPRQAALLIGDNTGGAPLGTIGEDSITLGLPAAHSPRSISIKGTNIRADQADSIDIGEGRSEYSVGTRAVRICTKDPDDNPDDLSCRAISPSSVAIGRYSEARGTGALAVGAGDQRISDGTFFTTGAWGNNSIALRGAQVGTSGSPTVAELSIGIGKTSVAGDRAVSIGGGVLGSDNYLACEAADSVLVGYFSNTDVTPARGSDGEFSVVLGSDNTSYGEGGLTIGSSSGPYSSFSTTIGHASHTGFNMNPRTTDTHSTAIGSDAWIWTPAASNYSVAIAAGDIGNYRLRESNRFAFVGGNLGINTPAPKGLLHVYAAAGTNPDMIFEDDDLSLNISDGNWPKFHSDRPALFTDASWGQRDDGGFSAVGISDGQSETPGVSIVGITGHTTTSFLPTVVVAAAKRSGNDFVEMGLTDVLARIGTGYPIEAVPSNSFVVMENGAVGINFPYNEKPTQSLEVNDTARLRPVAAAPAVCDGTNAGNDSGTIYVDSTGNNNCLCYCDGEAWHILAGEPAVCDDPVEDCQ